MHTESMQRLPAPQSRSLLHFFSPGTVGIMGLSGSSKSSPMRSGVQAGELSPTSTKPSEGRSRIAMALASAAAEDENNQPAEGQRVSFRLVMRRFVPDFWRLSTTGKMRRAGQHLQ